MRAFMAVLALVWTLLLTSIALDLRALNRSLAWLRLPTGVATAGAVTETREQRRERYKRESDAMYDDLIDRLHAAGAIDARSFPSKSRPSQKPAPRVDQTPSPDR